MVNDGAKMGSGGNVAQAGNGEMSDFDKNDQSGGLVTVLLCAFGGQKQKSRKWKSP